VGSIQQFYLQEKVMGSTGLFWNAIWFICDHAAYLQQIGIIKRDPFVFLNRVCVVAMQTCLNSAAIYRLVLSYREETELGLRLVSVAAKPVESKQDSQLSPLAADPSVEKAKLASKLADVKKQRPVLWIDWAKCFGDLVTCYDFGFNLQLNPLIPNAGGVLAASTGLYLEYIKATKRKN
jgi:hypothetical protein